MGRKKRLSAPNLRSVEKDLQTLQRENIKLKMSDLFKEMGLTKASVGVLKVKTKKQFKVYTSIARGWFKQAYGLANKKVEQAVELINKLEGMF